MNSSRWIDSVGTKNKIHHNSEPTFRSNRYTPRHLSRSRLGLLHSHYAQEHFCKMRVVGQFNLGFMICLLGSDLFILDQHACDEKYNFEVLQKTTTIHQQPLVR